MRRATILALLVALCATTGRMSASGRASAATIAPAAQLVAGPPQAFTGGGDGEITDATADRLAYGGFYTSNGQLGSGRFSFTINGSEKIARFTRSDGTSLNGTAALADECGPLAPNVECLRADLTGSSDIAQAHVDLSVLEPPFDGFEAPFLMRGTVSANRKIGYAMVDASGNAYTFGGIEHQGDAHTTGAVDIELTRSQRGYWVVNGAGQVFAFGDASVVGNADPAVLARGERVTSLSATPSGGGYWLFTSRGRALPFGDAGFFGDLVAIPLNGAIVGSIATPTGKGYYMVGSDGGVFAFGDARFRGSMGNIRLNRPVVGLVPTADNAGYWLVAADGGVFSFDAPFLGSMGAIALNRPIVALVPYDRAYLMVGSDGGTFSFSKGPFFGSKADEQLPAPVVNGAATG